MKNSTRIHLHNYNHKINVISVSFAVYILFSALVVVDADICNQYIHRKKYHWTEFITTRHWTREENFFIFLLSITEKDVNICSYVLYVCSFFFKISLSTVHVFFLYAIITFICICITIRRVKTPYKIIQLSS